MPRKPAATYRLQFHAGFGFDAAAAVMDYLKALGVSHVYCSPYLQAAVGSTHGYDVVDHRRVNEELGGEDAHARFLRKLEECGLGQVLDIVPNHMAISGRKNAWWWDVLENGPASLYASYFDIDWQTPEEKLRNKVLMPVLGNHYGRVLAAGEVKLVRERGSFVFRYFDHSFPLAPESTSELLIAAAERAGSDYLAFLADSLARLPLSTLTDVISQTARHRDKEVTRELLGKLCSDDSRISAYIDNAVRELNGNIDALDALLERQNYRLSFWRTAERELGYRRFFDVNTLIGLRMENPRVFRDTHCRVLDWLQRGILDGVRVDHPDGLRDPEQYFRTLHDAAPGSWVVAEKILETGERLPSSWPVAGTTGYDFLNVLGGLFIDPRGEEPLTRFYREFTGEECSYAELAVSKKQLVVREVLGSDVNRLTAAFMRICEQHRDHRDYTRHEIHHALREVVAFFPVYRTYVRAQEGILSDDDIRYTEEAVHRAQEKRTDLDPELFQFLRDVLLLRVRGPREGEFVMQFQQFTGPAMAKGVEDTAFYCYNRLVSLNEVGGDPGRFGLPLEEFHRYCLEMQRDWPDTMLASSTHDTKRSEDVRARISLLSEIPDQWEAAVRRWAERNEHLKTGGLPDRNTEYLLYQNLVGAWPISPERLRTYMEKAVREAKQQTSWTSPNTGFETALNAFLDGLFANADFLRDVESFVAPLMEASRTHSLSQTLVKLTAPGVPDIYQGTELWDLSLVDPDNRRPVDYEARRALLAQLDGLSPAEIMSRADEGLPKLWTIRQALRVRERLGCYEPLAVAGEKAARLIAFQRGSVICLAPRLVLGLNGSWANTSVKLPGTWRNELTGEMLGGGSVPVSRILQPFPVALLVKA